MTKNILLTIKDAHIVDETRESYEMTTRGVFHGNEDDYKIEYDEQYDELRGCHTVLSVKNKNCVSIVRTGSYSSEMMIERGKRHNCNYITPFGSMLIGIDAQKVYSTVKDGKGVLDLRYTIDFYGDVASQNELKIKIE